MQQGGNTGPLVLPIFHHRRFEDLILDTDRVPERQTKNRKEDRHKLVSSSNLWSNLMHHNRESDFIFNSTNLRDKLLFLYCYNCPESRENVLNWRHNVFSYLVRKKPVKFDLIYTTSFNISLFVNTNWLLWSGIKPQCQTLRINVHAWNMLMDEWLNLYPRSTFTWDTLAQLTANTCLAWLKYNIECRTFTCTYILFHCCISTLTLDQDTDIYQHIFHHHQHCWCSTLMLPSNRIII